MADPESRRFGGAEEAWRRLLRRRHCPHASIEEIYRAWLPKMTISQVGILVRALDPARSGHVSLQTFIRTLAPGCKLQDGLDALRQAAQRMDSKSLDPMPESMTADELWLWGKSWLRDERECMLVFRLVGQTTCRLDKSPLSPLWGRAVGSLKAKRNSADVTSKAEAMCCLVKM